MTTIRVSTSLKLQRIQNGWGKCQRCPLGCGTKHKALWDTLPAKLLECVDMAFVGEGPGEVERVEGMPFRGPAGQLLRRAVGEAGRAQLALKVVFLNLLACRPYEKTPGGLGNRPPSPEETAACRPRLEASLCAWQPKIVVACGHEAFDELSTYTLEERGGGVLLKIPHPAYIVRRLELYPEYVDAIAEVFEECVRISLEKRRRSECERNKEIDHWQSVPEGNPDWTETNEAFARAGRNIPQLFNRFPSPEEVRRAKTGIAKFKQEQRKREP